jgi:pimeloyl-ACP methyl ester carboxylesterase
MGFTVIDRRRISYLAPGRALGWGPFVVFGHSMGGAVALLTALHHADLLAGLVLVDTGARLRVNPALLHGAREAIASGRAPAMERAWTFASATPQSVVDALQALTADTDPGSLTATGSPTTPSTS